MPKLRSLRALESRFNALTSLSAETRSVGHVRRSSPKETAGRYLGDDDELVDERMDLVRRDVDRVLQPHVRLALCGRALLDRLQRRPQRAPNVSSRLCVCACVPQGEP